MPRWGGIFLGGASSVRVRSSTISGNTAEVEGGGIFSYSADPLWLENATITANSAPRGGGFAMQDPVLMQTRGSIIASNEADLAGPDCLSIDTGVPLVSDGFNLIGTASGCEFSPSPTDQVGSADEPLDPVLGALRDNGGPTPTHALLAGSPAIDAIPSPDCLFVTDQRGIARPQGAGCDIGSYELAIECDDGIDNDSDGLVDYPDDPDCRTASTLSETAVAVGPTCGLGPELLLITPLLMFARPRKRRRTDA